VGISKTDHKNLENYYHFFFTCSDYTDSPEIIETEKWAELKWFDIDKLPNNLIDHDRRAI